MTPDTLPTYCVTTATQALLSVAHPDYSTIIFENGYKFYVRQTPTQLIKKACIPGGSSYEGRRTAVSMLIGAKHKVPIPIFPPENIYAFPTHSPTQFECSWIFFHHVKCVVPYGKHSKVTFKNGQTIILPVSYYTIEKQMNRTAQCMVRFTYTTYAQQFTYLT